MTRMIIMGAGGRDFHDFNVLYRDDPEVELVAFTATQIPGIDKRTYPASLAGSRYPEGIPIHPEEELTKLIRELEVDAVAFCYSDIAYEDVMHRAAMVQAAGAEFVLHGPAATMLSSRKPVIGVCAVRTGSGKSQTTRAVGRILLDAGRSVALVRHPMPYHDLDKIAVQRFATVEDIDASNPTIEEREEYERPVKQGMVMYAGVDYGEILHAAEDEADVVVWDGGNNDMSFFKPDLLIVIVDALRAGDELAYHPGEANLRMADVVIVNKVDTATPEQIEHALANVKESNPEAKVLQAESPVTLDEGPDLAGKTVLVVEDGPTITHGDMPFGAGTVAARAAGVAEFVDPRPFAVGSIAETLERFPHIEAVLPAMGYGEEQRAELEQTINAAECDAVVAGTPIDLERVVDSRHPIRNTDYELRVIGETSLADIVSEALGASA